MSSPGLLFLLLLWLSGRCWARLAFPRCDRLPRSKGYELTPAGANFNTILHSVLQVGRKQGVSKATHTHTHMLNPKHTAGDHFYIRVRARATPVHLMSLGRCSNGSDQLLTLPKHCNKYPKP